MTTTDPTSSEMIGEEAGGDGEEDVKPLRCLIDGEIEISENPNIESSSCAAASNTSSLQVLKVNYFVELKFVTKFERKKLLIIFLFFARNRFRTMFSLKNRRRLEQSQKVFLLTKTFEVLDNKSHRQITLLHRPPTGKMEILEDIRFTNTLHLCLTLKNYLEDHGFLIFNTFVV
jgi:hypothetical protein